MLKHCRPFLLLLSLPFTACGEPTNPGAQSTTGTQSSPATQTPTGTTTGTGDSTGPSQGLTWTACEIDELPGFECAKLQVPLDYANRNGAKITLALSRKKHTDKDYRGIILSNPGGPGSPGRNLATIADELPNGVGKKYDWIGIDPRGTGESSPKLDCIGDKKAVLGLPYLPQNQAQTDIWKADAQRIAQNCAQGPGKELLPHMHTTDSVNDLEEVRKALGAEKITYWGASYGSYLGMVYATLHPDRIQKMVLDGVVSPTGSWYESNLAQQKAQGQSIEKFYEWLATKNGQFQLGSDAAAVRKRITDRLTQLRNAPVPTDGSQNMAQVLSEALQSASYGVAIWSPIGIALKMYLIDNDATILSGIAEGTSSDVRSAYLAVTCSEVDWPAWEKTLADAKASHEASPAFTWLNTWFNAPCVDWPIPATAQPQIKADKVNFPILLLGETLDGATPFSGALEARRFYPSSALVEGVGGTTHSASLASGPCVQDALFDFFSAGKLPPRVAGDGSDKKCDPIKPTDIPDAGEQRRYHRFR